MKKNRRRLVFAPEGGTIGPSRRLSAMVVIIDILDAPIKRIRKTCDLVDAREKFERLLPELEDFLEAEVARGVSSESQLTFDGLCFLKQAFSRL